MSYSSGIKYKKQNFKALKEEIANIKFDINKAFSSSSVLLNDKNEYVFRVQNRDSYFSRPSPEQKYLFNQILKHYELSVNHLIQGFNNKYFSKLSDLLSIKNIRTNDYSKRRIDLFNSRINENHKSYINYLKKNGEDVNLQSTISKKINPMNMTFNANLRNTFFNTKYRKNKNIQKIKSDIKKLNINRLRSSQPISNHDFSPSSFYQYKQNINVRNIISSSTARDDSFDVKRKIRQKNILNKSFSQYNINNNNDKTFIKALEKLEINNQINNDEDKNEKNDDEMDLREKKSKEEFLSTYNKKNYMKFLKFKYHFVEDKYSQEKEQKLTIEDIRRRNMFKFRPKNKFLDKKSKGADKFIFFKKIENENSKPNNSIIRIKIPKKGNKLKTSPIFSNIIINQSMN